MIKFGAGIRSHINFQNLDENKIGIILDSVLRG
jgi:hypothetical protein